MNLLPQAPARRIPLISAAGLVCAWAGLAIAWSPTVPPRLVSPDELNAIARAGDFRGLGAPDERSALPARQNEFRTTHLKAVIAVFPVRIGPTLDTECAVNLARSLPRAGVCHAGGVVRPVAFVAARSEADEKALWELAREFRDYVRKNPTGADYALYAEYALSPAGPECRAVHLVLCDARGEWVVVDRLNFLAPDLRDLRPANKTDADALVVRRLQSLLADASANSTPRDRDHGTPPIAHTHPQFFQP